MTLLSSQELDSITARDWQTRHTGTVRFAVIALGWFTRDHAIPAIQDTDLCDVTVTVSGSSEKAREVADNVGASTGITYDEFHDGAAREAYDAVYIVTPNALHLEYAESAASFGKDILCEKPMEVDVERAKAMLQAAETEDVRLMIAYRMQTEPAIRRAKELVQQGDIGDPVQIHSSMTHRLLELIPDPGQWRLDSDLAGGGALMDIGIYPLNTTRFVLDEDPVAVWATNDSRASEFDDVEERITFGLEFKNGITASCMASHNANQGSHLTIVGTEGEIAIDNPYFPWQECSVRVERGDNAAHFTFDQVNQLTEEFDYFANRVLSGEEIYPDGTHGLRDMRIIDALYTAAERGETVRLQPT